MPNATTTIMETFSMAINHAIRQKHAVALWSEPACDEFHLLIDQAPSAATKDVRWDSGAKGFILHPFINDAEDASILMNADLLFHTKSFAESDHEKLEAYGEASSAYDSLSALNAAEINYKESDYTSKVEHLLEELKKGSIKKIVLARHKDVLIELTKSPTALAAELRKLYPNAFIAFAFHPLVGCWVGASPELLASSEIDGNFNTIALAGTQAYNKEISLKDHTWTNKEIEEHAFVTRYIINCFKKIRLREYEEEGPKNYLAGNLVHLCTTFQVDAKTLGIHNLADQLLPLLHPTSATCGEPKEKAFSLIQQYEQVPRQLYAGFWGPLNMSNKSAVYVNLRCAQLFSNGYRAYAGAGITAASTPQLEWIETENKLQSIEKIWDKSF
jgi:isochorismate synthase